MAVHFFLTFEEAVEVTNGLISFFNNGQGDKILEQLGRQFNLEMKDNFRLHVDTIEKNCPECSGCHGGSCILGCLKHGGGQPSTFCFWDKALEEILGTRLILHEMGHLIKDQVFVTNPNPDIEFEESEEFAMFVENNVNIQLGRTQEGQLTDLAVAEDVGAGISRGFGFGIGLALLVGVSLVILKVNPLQLKGRKQR